MKVALLLLLLYFILKGGIIIGHRCHKYCEKIMDMARKNVCIIMVNEILLYSK